jgi:hypothetical protein
MIRSAAEILGECGPFPYADRPAGAPAMRAHDTRQIIIALTAIVLAWSIACLLTIAFGAPLPSETLASADRPVFLGDRLACHTVSGE